MLNQIRFSRGTSQPADGENVLNANAGNCHRSALEPRIFGWFEGPGIKGSLEQLRARKIPQVIAWLIIIGQVFWKYRPNPRFYGKSRRWRTLHHLYRCAHRSLAGSMDTELVWGKERRRN